MKKLAAILCLTALATGAFAQGLVKFANTSSTLTSAGGAVATGPFYYALLSAPLGTTTPTSFLFAGIYATNTATAGRLQGGSLLGVVTDSSWAPATSRAFLVAGWSANLGRDFNPLWMQGQFPGAGADSYFGISSIAEGRAGGTDPITQLTYPALAVFAGTTIPTGFNMTLVPEPASMALAGLGAAALLIFRRRK